MIHIMNIKMDVLLQSNDGIKWRIIKKMLRFNGKYK